MLDFNCFDLILVDKLTKYFHLALLSRVFHYTNQIPNPATHPNKTQKPQTSLVAETKGGKSGAYTGADQR